MTFLSGIEYVVIVIASIYLFALTLRVTIWLREVKINGELSRRDQLADIANQLTKDFPTFIGAFTLWLGLWLGSLLLMAVVFSAVQALI